MAAMELYAGRSDMAITGGIDTFNDIFMYMCFSKTPALSPTGDARPFAAGADGTILGEGLGVIVLKRLDLADAVRDGDTRFRAVITGDWVVERWGRGMRYMRRVRRGQVRCLDGGVSSRRGFSPDTIELVEGTWDGYREWGMGWRAKALEYGVWRGAEI